MPIPFLVAGTGVLAAKALLGATVVTGVVGAAKGVKGVIDSNEANEVMERAETILDTSKNRIEAQKKLTALALENFGKNKLSASAEELKEFLFYFNCIKNISLSDVLSTDEVKNLNQDNNLKSMEYVSLEAVDILKGGVTGVAAGTLLAWGSYGAVGALGAASTGASIAGLSGVAATNATLAWLGGGAIAAGGGGMALGSMVLGGLVAGPALLVAGGLFSAKAKEKLNNAYSNLSEAKAIAKKLEVAETELKNIENITLQIDEILFTVRKYLKTGNEQLKSIVSKNMDWKTYNNEEKLQVMNILKLAQGLKLIIDVPILNEDGSLTDKAKNLLKKSEPKSENLDTERKTNNFCTECGEKLHPNSKFCSSCGTRV